MIDLMATLCCSRCDFVQEISNLEDRADGERRASDAGWCEDEDGEAVCPDCWDDFDAKQESATSVDAVDPVDGVSTK